MKNFLVTITALIIALLFYLFAGGWLRPKEFMTMFRLRLIELGDKFKKARWNAGLRIIPLFAIGFMYVGSSLEAVHLRPDPLGKVMVEQWVDNGDGWPGYELVPHRVVKDYGVISRKVVTDAGVAALTNAFLNTFEPETFNYHASGTGGTAEAAAQTALVTEVETRVAGTQSAFAANAYRTVATVSYTATRTITEHGIFSASTVGTMLDRSLFTGIPVVSGDSIQFTYTFTITSGG